MRPKNLTQLLAKTAISNIPTLTLGSPGIGKSEIHEQAAKLAGVNFTVIYPALLDPTDLAGMPIPVSVGKEKRLVRLLDDELSAIFSAPHPTMVLLDELGQASPAMQAACAPLLLSRRIGKFRLPDHVNICCATNRRTDRAGAANILSHLISRMGCTISLDVSYEDWHDWAIENSIRHEIVSFLKIRSPLLNQFDPEKAYQNCDPYPCPRSWSKASDLLNAKIPDETEYEALSGCIGEGAAKELTAHLSIVRDLPDIEEFLERDLELPKSASSRWAVACAAAFVCNENNLDKVLAFSVRLRKEKLGEYSMLVVRDILRRWPSAVHAPAWNSDNGNLLRKEFLK